MDAVGVEVAGVTAQLHRVRHVHVAQLPLIGGAALHDVVDELELLEMLVGLAVELEVGLEVGLVGAQLADVCAGDEDGDLLLAQLGPVHRQVVRQGLQVVAAKVPTHGAVKKVLGVGVGLVHLGVVLPVLAGEEREAGHAGGHALASTHHLHE